MSKPDQMVDSSVAKVDPDPAEPRMAIWSTLRCLELQIGQHEACYNEHGVVSWELLKHMLRLAKRHACEEGGAVIAAERETDEWRTRADEANAKLRETEQELQRLRPEFARVCHLLEGNNQEMERLRVFVKVMRGLLTEEYADQRIIAEALDELDAGTIQPTPVAETPDAKGGA